MDSQAQRKARRSSILKTRNDGGSGEINIFGENGDTMGGGATRNLTGMVLQAQRRRVSFSHTNQVKEFEKSNSSTENSLSQTADLSKTTCGMDMSVVAPEDIGNPDKRGTSRKSIMPNLDMSVYGDAAASGFAELEKSYLSAQMNRPQQATLSKTTCDTDMSVVAPEDIGNPVKRGTSRKSIMPNLDMSVYGDAAASDFAEFEKSYLSAQMNRPQQATLSKTTCDTDMSVVAPEDIGNPYKRGTSRKSIMPNLDMSIDGGAAASDFAEFEKSYLSAQMNPLQQATLSKTTWDADMSVLIPVDKATCGNPHIRGTSRKSMMPNLDMSVYGSAIPQNKTVIPSNVDMSLYGDLDSGSMITHNKTVITPNVDMSVYGDPGAYPVIPQNKTVIASNVDMSVYGDLDSGTAITHNKTVITPNVDMSVYGDPNACPVIPQNKTMIASNVDMSVYGDPSACPVIPQNKTMIASNVDMSVYGPTTSTAKTGATKLNFVQPDPQLFRDPFGKKKVKRDQQISFGQFASAKTPKRKKVASLIDSQPMVVKKQEVPLQGTRIEHGVQTSPMVMVQVHNPEAIKHTREIGLNCTITQHVESDMSELNTTLGQTDSEKNRSATLYDVSSRAFDENSFRRKSEKTHDVLPDPDPEGSYCFEVTSMEEQTCTSPQAVFEDSVRLSERDRILCEETFVQSSEPDPTPGYSILKNKLLDWDNEKIGILEKWGFLSKILVQLSETSEQEWAELLRYPKIRNLFGEHYIDAVNINRKRLSDPLFQAVMGRTKSLKI